MNFCPSCGTPVQSAAEFCSGCGARLSSSNGSRSVNLPAVVAVACGLLVVVGSFSPWATVGIFEVDGTSGDGALTLVLGLLAGGGALLAAVDRSLNWGLWAAAALFGISAVIAGYDWINLEEVARENEDVESADSLFDIEVEVGWGLVLTTLASIAGVGAALWGTFTGLVKAPSAAPPHEDEDASYLERLLEDEVYPALDEQGVLSSSFQQALVDSELAIAKDELAKLRAGRAHLLSSEKEDELIERLIRRFTEEATRLTEGDRPGPA